MPLITVSLIEGVFTKEQKAQIIQKTSDALIEVAGEAIRPLTMAIIEEVKEGDWAIGGKPVRREEVQRLRAA